MRKFVRKAKMHTLTAREYQIATLSDPVIAAIEAHRRACAKTRAAYEQQGAVEDELARIRVPAGEVENDQRWIAANDAAERALTVQDALTVKLLETRPATIAGAAALLTYYVDAVSTAQAEVIFPDLDVIGRQLTDESRRDSGYLILRNVATVLSNMAANVGTQSAAAAGRRRTSPGPSAAASAAPPRPRRSFAN